MGASSSSTSSSTFSSSSSHLATSPTSSKTSSRKAKAWVSTKSFDVAKISACSSVRKNSTPSVDHDPSDSNQVSSSLEDCISNNRDVLIEWMEYELYLCKAKDSKKGLHHFIIATSKDHKVCCRLELTTQNTTTEALSGNAKAIFQMSNTDTSVLQKAAYQGTTNATLSILMSYGKKIVEKDYEGVYDLLTKNCQEFCNDFLKQNGLRGYKTTSKEFRDIMSPQLHVLPVS